jgi:two-component system cell cycle sensor histidine kinase/response regulator CckA
VQDTGCGIPQQVQEQVFEPFFTTRSVGQGSGLGLSRVRGYLEQIGGFVTLSSAVEQGTTVAMYFPVAPVDTRVAESADQPVAASHKKRLKALVVDDTLAVARVVARMLTSLGCDTLIASNGKEAREIIDRETGLDLLISDVVMPGESGLDLARAISRTYPCIRIALMSGYTQDEIRPEGGLEAIAFLAKPVSRTQLETFLESTRKSA